MAVIDIGTVPGDFGSNNTPGYTVIEAANPANDTGIIDTVQIWAGVAMTSGCTAGTLSAAGNVLTVRDSQSLGNIAEGSTQTITGLSIDVVTGDFIGEYHSVGSLRYSATGGSGFWYYNGEKIDPTDSATFTFAADFKLALYGTGTTPAGVVVTPTTVALTLTTYAPSITIIEHSNVTYPVVEISFTSALFSTPVWEDVSTDLLYLRTKRGRQSQLDRFEPGTATIILNNAGGNYWPDNVAGAHYGYVDLDKRIRIRKAYNTILYDEFVGTIDEWLPSFKSVKGFKVPVVTLSCTEMTAIASRCPINATYAAAASGVRIGNIADSISWPTGFATRVIDTGYWTLITTGALANANALELFNIVAKVEMGAVYQSKGGALVFEDFNHRQLSPHDVALSIFGDHTGEMKIQSFEPVLNTELYYNVIRANRVGGTEQVATDSVTPIRALVEPALPLATNANVLTAAGWLLNKYGSKRMQIKSLIINPLADPANLWPKVLGYDISDRITVNIGAAYVARDYFIENIEHTWDGIKGTDWETKWALGDAVQYDPALEETTETLRPNAAGDLTALAPFEGANYANVDEASADDMGTYNYATSGTYQSDLYNVAAPAHTPVSVSSVRVFARCSNYSGTGYAYILFKTNGTVVTNPDPLPIYAGFSNLASAVYATNPVTGLPWTAADIAALQIGVKLRLVIEGVQYGMCTQAWAVVTYIYAI